MGLFRRTRQGVVLALGAFWLLNLLFVAFLFVPTPVMRGDRATELVAQLWEAPLPAGAVVIAALKDGFQDPFLKIRIEAHPAQRAKMLAFLRVSEADLRQGRPHPALIGPEDWWIWPTDPGSVRYADLTVRGFDGVNLTLRTLDGPPARDIYFLYVWTM